MIWFCGNDYLFVQWLLNLINIFPQKETKVFISRNNRHKKNSFYDFKNIVYTVNIPVVIASTVIKNWL